MKYIFILFMLAGIINADYVRDDVKNTVYDTSTNLMWQDEVYTNAEHDAYNSADNNESTKALHWENAVNYCANLDFAGQDDWRLPNFNELYTLSDKTRFNPAIDPAFVNSVAKYFWSSTTLNSGTSSAWQVCFYCGDINPIAKTDTRYVRCVRTAN